MNKDYQEIWEIIPKVEVKDSYSLSLVYTPGVGTVSLEVADNTEKSFELTNRANSVAVISAKSGNIFHSDAQTKAILYNRLAKIDAYPLVIETSSPKDVVKIIVNLAPTFAAFVLIGLSEENKTIVKELLGKEIFNLPVLFDFDDDKEMAIQLRSVLGDKLDENFELPEESQEHSLGEKSVDLHRRSKGMVKISCNKNIGELSSGNSNIKDNLVAVISDGSAVLGLGNIGAEAGMPVMEGKSVLFKTLGNINAMPICLKTQDPNELIDIISKISPALGGINLEDISAPRCFDIEKTLIEKLDIPVFHDDQHGTAVVVLAGFINALKLTGKEVGKIKVVVNGAGAGATAVSKLLMNYGVKNLILCDRTGAIFEGRNEGMNPFKEEMAKVTNPEKEQGLLKDVIRNADFFIGLSSGNVVDQEMIKSMAKKAVVFALANPTPEIMPDEALKAGAFIVATGRSDYKNQVNNSLAFPGIFRGALDVKAKQITDNMKIAASWAIANLISDEELSSEYIIPHALDLRVPPAVSKAVAETAIKTGMARKIPSTSNK